MFLRHFGSCFPHLKRKNIYLDPVSSSVLTGGRINAFYLLFGASNAKCKLTGVIKMKIESLVWDKGKRNGALQVEQLVPGSCIYRMKQNHHRKRM